MSATLNSSAKSVIDTSVRAGMLPVNGTPLTGVASSVGVMTPSSASLGNSSLGAPFKQIPVRDTSSASINLSGSARGDLPSAASPLGSIAQGLEKLRASASSRSSGSSSPQTPVTLPVGSPLMPTFPGSSAQLGSNIPSSPSSGSGSQPFVMPSFPQLSGSLSKENSPAAQAQTPVVSTTQALPATPLSSKLADRIASLKASAGSKPQSASLPVASNSSPATPVASPPKSAQIVPVASPPQPVASFVSSPPKPASTSVLGSSSLPTRSFTAPAPPTVPASFSQRIESLKAEAATPVASPPKSTQIVPVASSPQPVASFASSPHQPASTSVLESSSFPTRSFTAPVPPTVPASFSQRIESLKAEAASKASLPQPVAATPAVPVIPRGVSAASPPQPVAATPAVPLSSVASSPVAATPAVPVIPRGVSAASPTAFPAVPLSFVASSPVASLSTESTLAQKIANFKSQSASQNLSQSAPQSSSASLSSVASSPVASLSTESTLAQKIANFKSQSVSQSVPQSSSASLSSVASKSSSSGSAKLDELRSASSSGSTTIATKLQQMKEAVSSKRATGSIIGGSPTPLNNSTPLPTGSASSSNESVLPSASDRSLRYSSPSTKNRASSPTLNLIASLRNSKSSGLGSQRASLRQEEQFSIPSPIKEATSMSTLPNVTGHEDPIRRHLTVLEKHFLTVDKKYHDRDSGIVYLDVYTKFGTELIIQITLEPGTTVFLADGHVFQKHEGDELILPHEVIDAECSKLGTCGMFFKKDAGAVVAHNREGVVHKTGYILSVSSEKSIKPDDSVVAIPVIPFEQLELEDPIAIDAIFRRAVQDARYYYTVAENNTYAMLNSSHDALGKFNNAYENFLVEYAQIIKKINSGLPYIETSIQKYELKTPDVEKFAKLSALRKELFLVKQKLITKAEELSMMVSHASKAADVITKRLEEGKEYFAKSDLAGGLNM
jgi:hypothetical protein